MAGVDQARQELADAVTAAGLQCLAYPPDNPAPPLGYVDDVLVDFTGSLNGVGSFCLPGQATATVVTLAQRNDRPGSMAYLEALMPAVLNGLYALPGIRIVATSSGQLSLGGTDLPAVTYTVQFLM